MNAIYKSESRNYDHHGKRHICANVPLEANVTQLKSVECLNVFQNIDLIAYESQDDMFLV